MTRVVSLCVLCQHHLAVYHLCLLTLRIVVCRQSDYVRELLVVPATSRAITMALARDVRDGLLTWLLVICAGRPSHVTGIRVSHLPESDARVSYSSIAITCYHLSVKFIGGNVLTASI